MASTTIGDLTLKLTFADSTSRTISFNPLPTSFNPNKAKIRALNQGKLSNGTTEIGTTKFMEQMLSKSGTATCTGIAEATYTITTTERLYDANSN